MRGRLVLRRSLLDIRDHSVRRAHHSGQDISHSFFDVVALRKTGRPCHELARYDPDPIYPDSAIVRIRCSRWAGSSMTKTPTQSRRSAWNHGEILWLMCAPEVPPAREMELSEPTGGGLRKSVRNGPAGRLRPSSRPAGTGTRIVDHLDRRLVNLLTTLGFALPVSGYFWFLERYSVDAVVGDQWDLISMIKQSYVQFFDWGPMWSQHNENRIFFPNMIVLLLVHADHFDIRTEQYLGALMLVAAVIFILWAHKRRSPSTPWLYYCPVAFLAFSVVQYGNTIWGFQFAWYVVLVCMAAALLLLDRVVLGWVSLVGAAAVAVLGSFSSLQGLLIWPTGLVLLYFRRRSPAQSALWVGVAIATTALYFHGYKSTTPGSSSGTRTSSCRSQVLPTRIG